MSTSPFSVTIGELLEPRVLLTSLPAGFTETLVTTSNLDNPTAMEFSPTGQLWVVEQGGAVKLVRGDGTTSTARSLTVDSLGERGLLGIAFDPSYDGAGPNADLIYLYYTEPRTSSSSPSHNRVSRFVVNNAGTTTPTLGAETIIRDIPPEDEDNNPATDGDSNHNGGAIHFGPDGKLYVAVGDHNYDQTPQSSDVAQTLTTPFGKVLRLNPNGTNPADNPFYAGSASDWRGAVYALGLRNPYTFAFQPGTSRMFINDVGESAWEEINDGIAGANYGWAGSSAPLWEGFQNPDPPWANYHDPLMAYDHSNTAPTPAGIAITGGAFYPAGKQFGSAYAGKYFFADYGANFIRIFDLNNLGSQNTPDTSTAFASAMTTASPVDLKVDAAGNLYYLARGAPGKIYRISFNAPSITQQPSNVTVNAGQAASFSVTANGGAPLSYQWQKFISNVWTNIANATSPTFTIQSTTNGDAGQYRAIVSNSAGSATSNAATLTVNVAGQKPSITQQPANQSINAGQNASFSVSASGTAPLSYQWQKFINSVWTNISGATAPTYTINNAQVANAGQYRAIVTNSLGSATSNAATLSVNRVPTATITAPATYTFGQTINFSATASDPEDGTLPASAYTWRVDFGHDTHFHPHKAAFSGVTGSSFVANFNEPDPDQFYRIVLTVKDSKGATFTTTRDVQPVKVQLTFASNPAGAPLTLDGQPVSGAVPSVVGIQHTLQAPTNATINGGSYNFANWSDGGAATHVITTPANNTTYTATYHAASAFSVKINFQDTTSQGFAGYLADTGAIFGNRGNGFSYGWNVGNAASARNRNAANSPDERYDTLNHMQINGASKTWEIAVPNGTYTVRLVSGDPNGYGSIYKINAENVLALDGTPNTNVRWIDRTATVTVNDGRLTLSNAAGSKDNKVCFIEITQTSSAFQQSTGADGIVSIEAENSDANISQGGKSWTSYTATAGFSGSGAMQATPNTSVNNDTGYVTNSPRLDYRINFTKTGTHYVWIRGLGVTGNDDSVHVGLDGAAVASADRITSFGSSDYTWTKNTMDGVIATINVTTTGLHTLNLWMREDGSIVDKILLTTSASYTPTGLGPAQSPQ